MFPLLALYSLDVMFLAVAALQIIDLSFNQENQPKTNNNTFCKFT